MKFLEMLGSSPDPRSGEVFEDLIEVEDGDGNIITRKAAFTADGEFIDFCD